MDGLRHQAATSLQCFCSSPSTSLVVRRRTAFFVDRVRQKDLPQNPGIDRFFEYPSHRSESHLKNDAELGPIITTHPNQLVGPTQINFQRLFYEDVFSRVRSGNSKLEVVPRRYENIDDIDFVI